MLRTRQSLLMLLLILLSAGAAFSQGKAPSVGLDLHASVAKIAPGEPFDLALRFDLPDAYHIYWENPGDSGMAPKVTWTLPDGFTAGPLQFPIPDVHEASGLTTNILKNKPILVTTITPPDDLARGNTVTIQGKVSWLVCKEQCFRGSREVSITLPTAAEAAPPSDDVALIFKIAELPAPAGEGKYLSIQPSISQATVAPGDTFNVILDVIIKPGFHAQSHKPLDKNLVPMGVFIKPIAGLEFAQPRWPTPHMRRTPMGRASEFTGKIQVQVPGKMVSPTADETIDIAGILKYQACNEQGQCFPREAVQWSVTVQSQAVRAQAELPETKPADATAAPAEPTATPPQSADKAEPQKPVKAAGDDARFRNIGEDDVADMGSWGAILHGLSQAVREQVATPDTKPADATAAPAAPAATPPQTADKAEPQKPVKAAGDDARFAFRTIGEDDDADMGIWGAILLGVLGGLILNIMPCVLPVISIKVLSFVQQANEKPRRVFQLGLVFSAGIVVSFWVLAAGILIIQASTGAQQSWGAFFQQPAFVIGMLIVVFVFALNLFGVFEVALPGRTATKLSEASEGEGFGGAFMKGVLATLLATPCTAPLLAPAISFALASSAAVVFVIFTAAGLGMALPYLLLTARPAWMKYLPRPGTWMVAFKQFMGFLLAGTAVWLLLLIGDLQGKDAMAGALVFLTFLGLAFWMFGRVQFGGSAVRRLTTGVLALIVLIGGGWAAYGIARPVQPIAWVPFEPGLPERLAAEGHTVYVDYTAAWCLTCQVNKKVAFSSERVLRKFEDFDVISVRADYTNPDPAIAADLSKFRRDAVPLNVVYPAGDGLPIRLPVVLTPSLVVQAVEMAGPSTVETAAQMTAGGA